MSEVKRNQTKLPKSQDPWYAFHDIFILLCRASVQFSPLLMLLTTKNASTFFLITPTQSNLSFKFVMFISG